MIVHRTYAGYGYWNTRDWPSFSTGPVLLLLSRIFYLFPIHMVRFYDICFDVSPPRCTRPPCHSSSGGPTHVCVSSVKTSTWCLMDIDIGLGPICGQTESQVASGPVDVKFRS